MSSSKGYQGHRFSKAIASAGEAWSVHRVPRATPPSYGELATRRRQGQLRAYRESTGQEPWDVPGSWPAVSSAPPTSVAGPAVLEQPAPTVRRLPPGPVYGDRWTARPRWR